MNGKAVLQDGLSIAGQSLQSVNKSDKVEWRMKRYGSRQFELARCESDDFSAVRFDSS
jgi:hypothetical protein